MFKNRQDAGKQLAQAVVEALSPAEDRNNIVVVGLPRGGVPVAKEVARALRAPLTILVSKKIGAPLQPEYAMGAISSSGEIVLNDDLDPLPEYFRLHLEKEQIRLAKETQELQQRWLSAAGLPAQTSYQDKLVVLVDDGIATGMTTLAALRSLKVEMPERLILATPVIPMSNLPKFQSECDKLIALATPYLFTAVGEFYHDFSQTPDQEVVACLKESQAHCAAKQS